LKWFYIWNVYFSFFWDMVLTKQKAKVNKLVDDIAKVRVERVRVCACQEECVWMCAFGAGLARDPVTLGTHAIPQCHAGWPMKQNIRILKSHGWFSVCVFSFKYLVHCKWTLYVKLPYFLVLVSFYTQKKLSWWLLLQLIDIVFFPIKGFLYSINIDLMMYFCFVLM